MRTVGQTDGHNSPDYTMSLADVQCNRIGPQVTLLMPLKDLTGSIMVLRDLTELTISHLYKQTCLSILVLLLCLDSV